jgi:flagellar biosynthetic protein FlhB
MSASETSREDRQLPATEQRLKQAREEGQIARSRDLVHLAAICALLALLSFLGPWVAGQTLELVGAGLHFSRDDAFEPARMVPHLARLGTAGLTTVSPLLAAMAMLLAGTTLAVSGWNLTLKALEPKFDRVNPLAGIGRLVGWRSMLGQLRVGLLAAVLLGSAAWYVAQHADEIDALSRMPLGTALSTGFGWLAGGLTLLAGVCLVAAGIDVPMQIFKHRADLRMTLEEVKKEHKESDGDPHVKGERRRRAREMSRGRMLAAVPTASVIITNPTHYAVALYYDENSMSAPRIVAMGADHLAFKIREVATAARVPVLEAPPLARALYKHGDIDAEVPVALYTAVAQVLAWVFRLRGALLPPPAPAIELPPGMDPLEAAR